MQAERKGDGEIGEGGRGRGRGRRKSEISHTHKCLRAKMFDARKNALRGKGITIYPGRISYITTTWTERSHFPVLIKVAHN